MALKKLFWEVNTKVTQGIAILSSHSEKMKWIKASVKQNQSDYSFFSLFKKHAVTLLLHSFLPTLMPVIADSDLPHRVWPIAIPKEQPHPRRRKKAKNNESFCIWKKFLFKISGEPIELWTRAIRHQSDIQFLFICLVFLEVLPRTALTESKQRWLLIQHLSSTGKFSFG